ncbi:MAG: MBOAT family protein [Bacteroidetes bacterium]|nr:MBOAT family protein [Bacteroidota bacterium]
MLFNSFEFAIFLPIVFLLYWFVFNKTIRLQNTFLLIAGYVFYGWWDWRFLFLIAFSTLFDFTIGLLLDKTSNEQKRKWLFASSCLINIGLLAFFKYFNFFIDNFITAFDSIGYHVPPVTLKIILPVGISFYTFQSLSYTTDIFRRKMKPTRDLISFAAFISFFPQLVAGPIERAFHLLPQFYVKREFDQEQAVTGMRQILWGLFKKIVIADTLASYVDQIFASYDMLPGSTLLLGAIYFSVQIYCDFSGYSSIAIGTARLFGFSLMQNFNYPYFSLSVPEFWRKWHISLTSWFRDYVYIPMGGSRGNLSRTIFNTLFVFTLSGFWHGANWTFIIWGLLNGLFMIPNLLSGNSKQKQASTSFSIKNLVAMLATFGLITFTWIFFRSTNVHQAFQYIQHIFSASLIKYPVQHGMAMTFPLIAILFLVEWLRKQEYEALQPKNIPVLLRYGIYISMIIICLAFFKQNQSFIYFQF